MEFKKFVKRPDMEPDSLLSDAYDAVDSIIREVKRKDVPAGIVFSINQHVDAINLFTGTEKALIKELKKCRSSILFLLEADLQLVTRNHYRKAWLTVGMMAFGVPAGLALGVLTGNMSLFVMGMPFGMIIGVIVGQAMDEKAFANGKQLNV